MARPEPAWATQARAEPTWSGWAPEAQDGLTAVDPGPRLTLLTDGARCSTTERRATAAAADELSPGLGRS